MHTLKIADLNVFRNECSFIKTNTIMPVLAYLRFDFLGSHSVVVKNNLKTFIKKNIPASSSIAEVLLVDEKILFNFCSLSSDEEITIYRKDKHIVISDSRNKLESPYEDPLNYPALDIVKGEVTLISEESLNDIKIASKFILDEDIPTARSFVFVGEGYICGSNSSIAYIKQVVEPIPKLILNKEAIAAFTSFNSAEYYEYLKYDVLQSGETIIGFIKPEYQFFKIANFLTPLESPAFKVEKTGLIKFNDLAVTSSAGRATVRAKFTVTQDKLILRADDNDFDIHLDSQIPIVNGSEPPVELIEQEFEYGPTLLSNLLKSLPQEEVYFRPGPARFYITAEPVNEKFISLIMKQL